MKRTTIRLDDELIAKAKGLAAATGRTLTSVIEDALRQLFARREAAGKAEVAKIPTYGCGGVLPGVDLDDSAAMLELMEAERHPSV